jgi:hypothetical protein
MAGKPISAKFLENLKKQIASLINDGSFEPTTRQDLGDGMERQTVTIGEFEYRRVAVTRSSGKPASVSPVIVWKGKELSDVAAETTAEIREALSDLDDQMRAKDRKLLPDLEHPSVTLMKQMMFNPENVKLVEDIQAIQKQNPKVEVKITSEKVVVAMKS